MSGFDKIKKVFPVIVLVLLLVPAVILIGIRQLSPKASNAISVQVSPGAIDQSSSPQIGKPVYLSATAVDEKGRPITSGVSYTWGISSNFAVSPTFVPSNNLATFTPNSTGSGSLWVSAITSEISAIKYVDVCVGVPCPSYTDPTPFPTPPTDPSYYKPLEFNTEILQGSIITGGYPSPFSVGGYVNYYTFTLPNLTDYRNVEVFFRSCPTYGSNQNCQAFSGFTEELYLFDSGFRQIYSGNTRIDFDSAPITPDKKYYLAVEALSPIKVPTYLLTYHLEGVKPTPTPTSTPVPNRTPVITTTSLPNALVGQQYNTYVYGSDSDSGDKLSMKLTIPTGYGLSAGPCAVTPGRISCNIYGTPVKSSPGIPVTVSLSDGKATVSANLALSINPSSTSTPAPTPTPTPTSNTPPTIVTKILPAGYVGRAYSTSIAATDPNLSDNLKASVTGLPLRLSLTGCTQFVTSVHNLVCTISGTPNRFGTFPVRITVTDSANASTTKVINLPIFKKYLLF